MSAETIGMAQKGGSVFSFLRLGDDIYCPMFPEKTADIIIGFEPAEAVRMLPYLKGGGQVVVNTHPIMPVTATLSGSDYTGNEMLDYLQRNVKNVVLVDGNRAIEEIGSPKVLNMVMLGAAVRNGVLPFSVDDIEDTMKKTVKPQFIELNSKALRYNG
jgi:indolepyruvate ferredoxin oxidoreductase beta subunit